MLAIYMCVQPQY